MIAFLVRRFFGALLVMFVVATLVFFMLRIVPGDPIAAMLADAGGPRRNCRPEAENGPRPTFDRPVFQMVRRHGAGRFRQVDLRQPATGCDNSAGSPATYSFTCRHRFVIALVIGVPAGIISAMRRNTPTDTAVSLFAFLGLSMPDFWLAILLIIVFAANLQWLPAIGYVPISEGFWPWLSHLILPSIAVGTAFSAIIARMIRSSLLETLRADYMRTAASKGLPAHALMLNHAFPNAMIPVITVIGIAFALLIQAQWWSRTSSPSRGWAGFLIGGILNRDYPVVQGAVLVVSAFFVFSNMLVDLLLWCDRPADQAVVMTDTVQVPENRKHRERQSRLRATLAKDRKAQFGLVILFLFVLGAVFAPWLAPNDPNEMTLDMMSGCRAVMYWAPTILAVICSAVFYTAPAYRCLSGSARFLLLLLSVWD